MLVLGIDPGPKQSAWLLWDPKTKTTHGMAKEDNKTFLLRLKTIKPDAVSLEGIQSYGQRVGAETFETCYMIGRIQQIFQDRDIKLRVLFRKTDVCKTMCFTTNANDSGVRQALVDRFGEPGTKKAPGRLYGVSKDIWSALALAVTYCEQEGLANINEPGYYNQSLVNNN